MVVGEHMGEERSPERIPQKYVNIITIVMRVFITKVHLLIFIKTALHSC